MAEAGLRLATSEDMPKLLQMIKDFLPFVENSPGDDTVLTVEELVRDGFGERSYFDCLLLELTESGKPTEVIGYTLYFFTYSTWAGRVLFMEDLYISPKHHRKGYGKLILTHLSQLALEKQCRRLSWQGMLDRDAAKFYARIGAQRNDVWSNYKLDVSGMEDLAAGTILSSS